MSIFGQLDAENIPSNPNFIEKGEYSAEVTKALFKDNRDGNRQLVIEYTITEDGSQYDKYKPTQYFNLIDSEMTAEAFALLPAEEKRKIQQVNAKIKRTLCGTTGSSTQKGLGVDPSDLNDPNWNPEVIMGTKIKLGISNFGSDGVNVQWVNLIEE
jgi:hypothetical protein